LRSRRASGTINTVLKGFGCFTSEGQAMGSLEGKVVAISGGARGMGASEARLFVAEGAQVAIGDVLDQEGEALAQELGSGALYAHLDVSKETDWIAFFDTIRQRFGRLDGLVNNAGIMVPGALADLTPEQYTKTFEINQLGPLLGIKHAAPLLRAAGGGSIVNLSSSVAVRPFAGIAAYATTKWAIRGLTRVAALELVADNIRVNAVLPGYIRTPMTAELGPDMDAVGISLTPTKRAGTSEEVAQLVRFLISDESAYISGADYAIDGASTA
jgi:3alpha(or 20beta)-hydroxysteroid dehydrogenase